MSDADSITVTINGHDSVQKAVEDVMNMVMTAATEGTETAADSHLSQAKYNVENAYTEAGYEPISFMYARWLAARDPRYQSWFPEIDINVMDDTKKDWLFIDNKRLNDAADIIFSGKTSMISGLSKLGPSLMEGLRVYEIEETRSSVSKKVVSEASYSDDLEQGYLFGKYRGANKRRPFFTGHTTATRTLLRDIFLAELGADATMNTTTGIQRTGYDRSGVAAIFDIFLSKLKEKASVIRIPYGIPDDVEPFYTVAFPKSYGQFPAVCLTVATGSQREGAIGRMIGGNAHGDESGVLKTTTLVFDVWARNSLELEVIASRVEDIFERYKLELYELGIIDYSLTKTVMRPYDPNAPRMWFGSEQAPGETWLRALEYQVTWFHTWGRDEEVYDIKRIDATIEPYGTTVDIQYIGALHMGLLDTMFYERFLGRTVKLPEIMRGRY